MSSYFIFQHDRLLLQKENHALPHSLNLPFLREYFLGTFNDTACYCAEIAADIKLPDNIEALPLRKAFEIFGELWFVVLAKAISIITWDKNHHYCGRCGHTTVVKSGHFERVCPQCGLSFYPRISPSIIVLIHDQDKILMSRSPHFTPGVYALIAGFIEVGESIEAAVHREVAEEVGITIKNLQYFGSQSWPFPDSLMIAFIAEYAGGELVIDKNELETAGWYRYDNLPGMPSHHLSIARKLIEHFIEEQRGSETNGMA